MNRTVVTWRWAAPGGGTDLEEVGVQTAGFGRSVRGPGRGDSPGARGSCGARPLGTAWRRTVSLSQAPSHHPLPLSPSPSPPHRPSLWTTVTYKNWFPPTKSITTDDWAKQAVSVTARKFVWHFVWLSLNFGQSPRPVLMSQCMNVSYSSAELRMSTVMFSIFHF